MFPRLKGFQCFFFFFSFLFVMIYGEQMELMYPVFYIQLRLCLGFIKVTIVQRLCILTSTSNYQSHSFNHITIHKLLCILMYSFFRRHWLNFALPFCVVFSLLMNDAHMHKFKWHWFPKWICFKVEGVFPFF